jgi:hypothetical protein
VAFIGFLQTKAAGWGLGLEAVYEVRVSIVVECRDAEQEL